MDGGELVPLLSMGDQYVVRQPGAEIPPDRQPDQHRRPATLDMPETAKQEAAPMGIFFEPPAEFAQGRRHSVYAAAVGRTFRSDRGSHRLDGAMIGYDDSAHRIVPFTRRFYG